jgi:N6-adenosine-specific RNA methylase IME4
MKISDIITGQRHRKNFGDVKSLATSIESVGLLHPIVVDAHGVLIAGERRIEAFKLLGRDEIPATTVDLEDITRGEVAENYARKDFAPSEMVAIRRALEPQERQAAAQRMKSGKPSENFSGGNAIDKVAEFTGVSRPTLDKATAVVEAAEADPEKFGHLVEQMDRTGKVTGAYRKVRMANDEARIMNVKPVVGRHRTIVMDPPWDYDWLSLAGRAAPGYATMPLEEIADLPVSEWADDPCHLYLWTTNNFMGEACKLVSGWGFQHRTLLTWVKPRWGLGSYFRNSTEHVLFSTRGKTTTRRDDVATHFEAPVTEHSVKPDVFYEIVEKMSYPPYGEAFQRQDREQFHNLFESSDE